MQKTLFLQPDATEYIGVMSISAFLKQNGFFSELFLERNKYRIIEYVKKLRPQIIAFFCMTPQISWVIETSKFIKNNYRCFRY